MEREKSERILNERKMLRLMLWEWTIPISIIMWKVSIRKPMASTNIISLFIFFLLSTIMKYLSLVVVSFLLSRTDTHAPTKYTLIRMLFLCTCFFFRYDDFSSSKKMYNINNKQPFVRHSIPWPRIHQIIICYQFQTNLLFTKWNCRSFERSINKSQQTH